MTLQVEHLSRDTLGSLAAERPAQGARGWVKNLLLEEYGNPKNPDMIEFPFRPTTVNVNTSVNEESMAVIGMSHEYQSYKNTSNVVVSFELYMNALMMIKDGMVDSSKREGGKGDLISASNHMQMIRRFFESLCYPAVSTMCIIGSEQPPVMLCIPGVCCIRAKLKELSENHERCDIDGFPTEMRFQVTFTERPMSRITMEDVLTNGLYRRWGI